MLALGALLALAGCGGSGGVTERGEVSGVIFDADGTVVRDARVYYDSGRETRSNVGGVYVLNDMPAKDLVVKAEIVKNGVTFRGQNVARVSNGERTKDVNIALYRSDQIATVEGTIRDRQGRLLSGMRVFMRPADDSILTSSTAITNNDGYFRIGGLGANISYRVQANGLGYNSDFDTISLNPGETRYVEFTAPDQPGDGVYPPENLSAYAYTTPASVRGSSLQSNAMEAMKQILNPKRTSKPGTRLTSNGNRVEVDLFWDRPSTSDELTALLGYAIYRGTNSSNLTNTDFLRDPQARFFSDLDDSLIEQVNYTYAMTALDTLYDGSEGESGRSNTATVRPLGDMRLGNVNNSSRPTFTWSNAPGAASYVVYIFDNYPSIYETERYLSAPITGNTFNYNDVPLGSGRTFYYVIVAMNTSNFNTATAYSISPVGQFTVR